MSVHTFPAARTGNPSIAGMRCAECGAAPVQIITLPTGGGLMPFCSPLCAAGCGVEPWASADLVLRMAWAADAARRGEVRA